MAKSSSLLTLKPGNLRLSRLGAAIVMTSTFVKSFSGSLTGISNFFAVFDRNVNVIRKDQVTSSSFGPAALVKPWKKQSPSAKIRISPLMPSMITSRKSSKCTATIPGRLPAIITSTIKLFFRPW